MQAETSRILFLKFEARITFWVLLKSSMHVRMCGCTHTQFYGFHVSHFVKKENLCIREGKGFFFLFFFFLLPLS